MTNQRDIRGVLDAWLNEGARVAPDSVIDVVADRIDRQRQRGAWRYAGRDLRLAAILRYAAVAAAVALVAAGAIYLAGSLPPTHVVPSPSATVNASPSPSPYVLPSGLPYQSPGLVSSTAFRPNFQIDAPLGWTTSAGPSGFAMTLGLIHDEALGDSGRIAGSILMRPNPVLGNIDSCPAIRTAAPTLGPPTTAAEMVNSLVADPRFAVIAGPAIAIDGWPAQVLDVRLAPTFSGRCMGGSDGPSALLFDEPGSFVVLEGERRMRLILLDVDGVPLAILIMSAEEAYDAFVARSMGVLQSLTFLP